MTRRRIIVGAAGALVVGGIVAGGITAATAGDLAADSVVSILKRPATVSDILPGSVQADEWGRGGLVEQSVRYVGADGPRQFWIAEDSAGELCVIVALGDPGQTIGGACNFADRVAKNGQALGTSGSDGVTYVTYLLPDTALTNDLGNGWKGIGSNIVVAAADEGAASVEVPIEGGGSIELRRS